MRDSTWEIQPWIKGLSGYSSPSIIKIEAMLPFLLSSNLSYIYDGKTIIDLGCGPGHVAKTICDSCEPRAYLGIDFSDDFIKNAQKLNLNSSTKPNFEVQNLLAYSNEDNLFDTALCINVIPTIGNEEDLDLLFNTIKKSIKSGGHLVFMSTNDDYILSEIKNDNFQVTLVDARSTPVKCMLKVKNIEGGYFEFSDNCWTKEIIEDKFRKYNFQVIDVQKIGGTKSFQDHYPFIGYVLKSI